MRGRIPQHLQEELICLSLTQLASSQLKLPDCGASLAQLCLFILSPFMSLTWVWEERLVIWTHIACVIQTEFKMQLDNSWAIIFVLSPRSFTDIKFDPACFKNCLGGCFKAGKKTEFSEGLNEFINGIHLFWSSQFVGVHLWVIRKYLPPTRLQYLLQHYNLVPLPHVRSTCAIQALGHYLSSPLGRCHDKVAARSFPSLPFHKMRPLSIYLNVIFSKMRAGTNAEQLLGF